MHKEWGIICEAKADGIRLTLREMLYAMAQKDNYKTFSFLLEQYDQDPAEFAMKGRKHYWQPVVPDQRYQRIDFRRFLRCESHFLRD